MSSSFEFFEITITSMHQQMAINADFKRTSQAFGQRPAFREQRETIVRSEIRWTVITNRVNLISRVITNRVNNIDYNVIFM